MKQPMRYLALFHAAIFLTAANTHADEAFKKNKATPTILISFDGAQPAVIDRLLKSGKLSKDGGFAKMIRGGTQAKGMASVLPTVTATNHISIATGAYPERTKYTRQHLSPCRHRVDRDHERIRHRD